MNDINRLPAAEREILFRNTAEKCGISPGIVDGECPNAQLKEVKNRKGDSRAWMSGTTEVLLKPEAMIGLHKNSQDSLKIFQLSRKTPAAARQSREIMAQISVDTCIEEDDPQTVCFGYLRSFQEGAILPVVRLEIGALAAWTPAKQMEIAS